VSDQLSRSKPQRNLQLDVLRAVAIFMVLVCHSFGLRKPTWDLFLWRPGWSGVDLFFVISGFLISGLLFSEYRRTGKIRFARFFIRRAFKIYPAFYAVVFLTLKIIPGRLVNFRGQMISDLLFLQAYRAGTWGHFWSLSVEEHFYLILPFALWAMIRFSKGVANPFRRLPVLFLVVAIATLVARLLTAKFVRPFQMQTHLFPTHLRLDSLLFGVLLGYYFHFHREGLSQFVMHHRRAIICAGCILVSPLFFIGQFDQWTYTYGFVCAYLGYGFLMIAFLHVKVGSAAGLAGRFLRPVAYIGSFSYSIYLWHYPWIELVNAFPVSTGARLCWFYGGSILLGISAGRLIEVPALRLREAFFPRVSSPAEISASGAVLSAGPVSLPAAMMEAGAVEGNAMA